MIYRHLIHTVAAVELMVMYHMYVEAGDRLHHVIVILQLTA